MTEEKVPPQDGDGAFCGVVCQRLAAFQTGLREDRGGQRGAFVVASAVLREGSKSRAACSRPLRAGKVCVCCARCAIARCARPFCHAGAVAGGARVPERLFVGRGYGFCEPMGRRAGVKSKS
eukprot:4219312-Lingulodinium_polyedra.AAC.3